jgi:hypothetical protein
LRDVVIFELQFFARRMRCIDLIDEGIDLLAGFMQGPFKPRHDKNLRRPSEGHQPGAEVVI